MKRLATVLAATWLLLGFSTARAAADEIHLKNGNHLTGAIVFVGEDKLVLETDFAGRLSIDCSRIERISAATPVTPAEPEGSTTRGTTACAEATGAAGTLPVPPPAEDDTRATTGTLEEVPNKLSGRINVGLNKASGNTDRERGHLDAELGVAFAKHHVSVGGSYNRARDNNRTSEDNVSGYSQYNYFLTEALYSYLKVMGERDTFKDINLRTTMGPGLGYQIFAGELMNLSIEAGPSYVRTDYDQAHDEDSVSGRWGVKFDRFFFEKLVQYYFTNEGYISASDYQDVFMFTRTGLRFPIRGGLFFTAGFEWDWDNTPAEDTDKSDYRYVLSIGFGF
jgi:putative salt-induced outer membrane protein YdiY